MIPREQLEQWRALANAAAPGPWFLQETPGSYAYIARWVVHEGEKLRCEVDEDADLAFAAAAREAVPALISEVEAQAEEIERMRAVLGNVANKACVPALVTAAVHVFRGSPLCGEENLCATCAARAALKEGT